MIIPTPHHPSSASIDDLRPMTPLRDIIDAVLDDIIAANAAQDDQTHHHDAGVTL